MNVEPNPELQRAERARRATRNAAMAALAAFALDRREEFERFLTEAGEEPEAFVERWVETWAEAYRIRQAVLGECGLGSDERRIATYKAYQRATRIVQFVAEDLSQVHDDEQFRELVTTAGFKDWKDRRYLYLGRSSNLAIGENPILDSTNSE